MGRTLLFVVCCIGNGEVDYQEMEGWMNLCDDERRKEEHKFDEEEMKIISISLSL